VRANLNLLAHRLVFEALENLHVHIADGKLDLERAVDVGKGTAAHADVGAVILKPRAVDLRTMTDGRNVPAILGAERQAHRRRTPGGAVHDFSVQPDLLTLQHLNARARGRARQFTIRFNT